MKIVSMFPVIPAKALHRMVYRAKAGIQVLFLRVLDSRLHACVPKRLYFGVQARE
jgi:hypothetical protein